MNLLDKFYIAWRRGLEGSVIAVFLIGCSAVTEPAAPTSSTDKPTIAESFTLTGQKRQVENTVLVFGDSLSAGYGMRAEQSWVALLDQKLTLQYPGWGTVNASISGETTAGGLSRIDEALKKHQPKLVVIALGANDGLRGLPLEQTRANLQQIIERVQTTNADVVIAGMRIPPNYGFDYAEQFFSLFADLAKAKNIGYLPFLLEPIATDRDAFQNDNLHPTVEAQSKLLEHVWPVIAEQVSNK